MFTGIIEAVAEVIDLSGDSIKIARPEQFEDITLGCSIAVSGVCLSVTEFSDDSMTFGVVKETWGRTSLQQKKTGDSVNLERAVRADQRLDGHIVQGHIEGVGTVESFTEDGALTVGISDDLIKFCVQKGSITIDGVSLTITDVADASISVALVPHTLQETTLGTLKQGSSVNIETDVFGRYVHAFTVQGA